MQPLDQLGIADILERIPEHTGIQRGLDMLWHGVRREYENTSERAARAQLGCEVDSRSVRQAEIRERQPGLEPVHCLQRLSDGPRFADDLKRRIGVEQGPQGLPQ